MEYIFCNSISNGTNITVFFPYGIIKGIEYLFQQEYVIIMTSFITKFPVELLLVKQIYVDSGITFIYRFNADLVMLYIHRLQTLICRYNWNILCRFFTCYVSYDLFRYTIYSTLGHTLTLGKRSSLMLY